MVELDPETIFFSDKLLTSTDRFELNAKKSSNHHFPPIRCVTFQSVWFELFFQLFVVRGKKVIKFY